MEERNEKVNNGENGKRRDKKRCSPHVLEWVYSLGVRGQDVLNT